MVLVAVVFSDKGCGASLALDVNKMTQFPSQRTVVVLGVAALSCIATGIRWLHFVPNLYIVVIVIRQGLGQLMMVIVGILLVELGIMFVGMYLSRTSSSLW